MSETVQQATATTEKKPTRRKNDNQVGQEKSKMKRISELPVGLPGLDEQSFEMLEEHVRRYGKATEDDMIISQEKAERMRRMRENLFGDVKALLKHYRGYRRLRALYLEEISERSKTETAGAYDSKDENQSAFELLAQRLELMDAAEERKFVRSYQPYIETGLRIEKALTAVDMALRDLHNESAYNMINSYYIEGEKKPPIKEMTEKFNCSVNKFYSELGTAIQALTLRMFGVPGRDDTREVRAILAYLRIQTDDRIAESTMMEYLGA